MIDLHSHILHSVDDGSGSLEESHALVKELSLLGFLELIPTPHRHHLFYNVQPAEAAARIAELASSMVNRFSFEYMYHAGSLEDLPDLHELAQMASGWRVALIEFLPVMSRKADVEKAVYQLNVAGIAPLIAHIERYALPDEFWLELKSRYKVFYQICVRTLSRRFFDAKRNQVLRFLDFDIVDNAATDIHKIDQIRETEQGINYLVKHVPETWKNLFSLGFAG